MSASGPGNLGGVLLVALLAGAAAFTLGAPQDKPPLLLNVSLDSPAEERWEPVMKHFDMTFLKQVMTGVIESYLPKSARVGIRPIVDLDLELIVRQPYAGEIKGIAKYMGISPSDVFLYNLCYEMTAYCTSIVAQDREGHVFHGRNLDYFFPDVLRNLTVDLQFVKNGKIAYKGTSFVGYIGLWTAQKPYAFTISADERDSGTWWENVIAALWKRSTLVSWLVRDVLSEAEDFQAAVLSLSKTPIIANVYYIVGGTAPGEGVVITRDRDGQADIWPLDPLQGGWFRVETNYDHWKDPPPSDDRRTPANKEMNATGQENINLDTLYKVLSVFPIINNLTVYTTVMSAAFPDQYRTRIRMYP